MKPTPANSSEVVFDSEIEVQVYVGGPTALAMDTIVKIKRALDAAGISTLASVKYLRVDPEAKTEDLPADTRGSNTGHVRPGRLK